MKMRKILPLVILAVTAFFLLSGCDALLDAIFSKDQITVDVAVYTPSHSDYAVGGYVVVQIWNPSGMISQDSKGNSLNRHMVVPIHAEAIDRRVNFINPFGNRRAVVQ